ncbi:hypothetical protein EA187_14460 [Lujinxingia sediminis]|uniref:DUF2207 domain-containing protein n=1 Tax=Lujinxingia sediminis TaxID=2480984 RepID=A0ABY0CR63_9DELT|nr:hypothetical protein [Lujinxingia sediminis]RVU42715.1 hypothetical protein EA187_14460 [Lujinxingia sediminis]
MRRLHQVYVGCLALVMVLWTASAAAEAQVDEEAIEADAASGPCVLEAVEGGVRCMVGAREVVELEHPTLYGDPTRYRERQGGLLPVGPVRLGERYYYGVRAELLVFDPHEGAVVERVALPTTLREIEAVREGDTPYLRLHLQRDPALALRYTPGTTSTAAAYGGPWSWPETLGAMQDALWREEVALGREPGAVETPDPELESQESDDAALLEAMSARAERDRTNIYYALYRAEALLRLARGEEAESTAWQAAERDAPWYDLLRASARLHYLGLDAAADLAMGRGIDAMHEAGVRSGAITSPVAASFMFIWLREALDRIAGAPRGEGDDAVAAAAEVLNRAEEAMPNAEGLRAAWRALDAESVAHLTRPGLGAMVEEAVDDVDTHLVIGLGLLLAMLGGGAVVGLGRGRGRWVAADVVVLASLLAISAWNLGELGRAAQRAAVVWEAPVEIGSDALNAPGARAWIDGLADSGASSQLREIIGAQELAMTRGRPFDEGIEDTTLVRLLEDALHAHLDVYAIDSPAELEVSPALREEFGWLDAVRAIDLRGARGLLVAGGLVLNALMLGGLVWVLLGRSPALGRRLRGWWPGAPAALGPARVGVWAAFCVGLVGVTPLASAVHGVCGEVWAGYYGLAPLAEAPGPQSWAVMLLVGALGLHLGAVVWERSNEARRARRMPSEAPVDAT